MTPNLKTPRFPWIIFLGLVVAGLTLVKIASMIWMYFLVDDFSVDGTYGVLTLNQQIGVVGLVMLIAAPCARLLGRRASKGSGSTDAK